VPLPTVLSPQTVVELFFQTAARKLIVSQVSSQRWTQLVSNVVVLLAQLLYPLSRRVVSSIAAHPGLFLWLFLSLNAVSQLAQ